jgi:hypothetical protein
LLSLQVNDSLKKSALNQPNQRNLWLKINQLIRLVQRLIFVMLSAAKASEFAIKPSYSDAFAALSMTKNTTKYYL